MRERNTRLGYVDGLRAIAALVVVMDHAAWTIKPSSMPQQLWYLFTLPVSYGHTAVAVFIVLSGFSLMLPVARNANQLPQGMWGFYRRRVWRILPPYYAAMGLSLLLIWSVIGRSTGTEWDGSLPVTGRSILIHLALLQDFSAIDHWTINGAFWSIALECQIYLVFPALLFLWWRYHPAFAALLVLALSLILCVALTPTWIGQLPFYPTGTFAPQFIGLFALGMGAASIHTDTRWSRIAAWRGWVVLSGASLIALAIVITADWSILVLDPLIGLMTVSLLLTASHAGRVNPVCTVLSWRPFVWIGGFSYSLYLIHAPLIQLIWQYGLHPLGLNGTLTYLLLIFVGLPLILGASWLFWYCCERPFLNTTTPVARFVVEPVPVVR